MRRAWQRLCAEGAAFGRALAALDRQTLTVLCLATILAIAQYKYGTRQFFRTDLAGPLGYARGGLAEFIYHCLCMGVTGFIIPLLTLTIVFRRRPTEIGFGLGDWKLALLIAALYVPVVTLGTWYFSAQVGFLNRHPQISLVARDWQIFLIYELVYLVYWIGWEYLWRGFVLFGTAHTFGHFAIVVQMIPFAILHYRKPGPEAFLSVLGGLLLGALVWRCRAFWIAVPIHWYQMLSMDFFCTLRHRTGVRGVDPAALLDAFRGIGG